MKIQRFLGLTGILVGVLLASAAVAQPRHEVVRVEPRREVVRVEPRREVVRVEPRREIVRVEPRRDFARVEPRRDFAREVVLRDRYRLRVNEYRVHRAELRRDVVVWRDRRPYRAWDRRVEIARTWGVVVVRPEARVELGYHAERMARLNRILDLAEESHDEAMAARTRVILDLEGSRHVGVMVGFQGDAQVGEP